MEKQLQKLNSKIIKIRTKLYKSESAIFCGKSVYDIMNLYFYFFVEILKLNSISDLLSYKIEGSSSAISY